MTSPEPEVTGNDVTGTGSDRKSHDRNRKWRHRKSRDLNRKSRALNGKTAEQLEKSIAGSGWGQTAEKRGLKVQSPIQAAGVVPGLQKKKTPCWKKKDLFQNGVLQVIV